MSRLKGEGKGVRVRPLVSASPTIVSLHPLIPMYNDGDVIVSISFSPYCSYLTPHYTYRFLFVLDILIIIST
jgi:hypothetical protein